MAEGSTAKLKDLSLDLDKINEEVTEVMDRFNSLVEKEPINSLKTLNL